MSQRLLPGKKNVPASSLIPLPLRFDGATANYVLLRYPFISLSAWLQPSPPSFVPSFLFSGESGFNQDGAQPKSALIIPPLPPLPRPIFSRAAMLNN